ncbi:MAG: hypothetical protein IKT08_09360 [Bacteroidales bacterium]|nr:hypothetical protein [Bacteroidales bacterium]
MTYNVPFKVSLRDYEGMMNSREYWDDLGAEWSWSTIEKKLVRLAGFVQQGGNLKKVINRYAKEHDERYNCRIQYCVLYYILKLMVGNRLQWYGSEPLVDRIKCLNKDELIRLLTAELKRDVVQSCHIDEHNNICEHWELLSDTEWLSDVYLDRIERHHWRTHPQESPSQYFRRAEIWWRGGRSLW